MLWVPHWRIERPGRPAEEWTGNALAIGGASAAWDLLMGRSGVNPYSAANAYLAVGNSDQVPSPSQTSLRGTTTARRPMMTGYPKHTISNTEPTIRITFKANFPDGVAEFHWHEAGLFNAASGGRMFNRMVRDMGEKPADVPGLGWVLYLVFSIEPEPASAT